MAKTIATLSLKTGFNLTNLLLVSAFAPRYIPSNPLPHLFSLELIFPAS